MRIVKICVWMLVLGCFGFPGVKAQLVDTMPANRAMHQASAYWAEGKQEASLASFQKAVDIYKQAETWYVHFEAVGQLSQGYYYARKIQEGLAYAESLDTTFFLERGILPFDLSNLCLNIGALYEIAQLHEKADAYYEKAIQGYWQKPENVDSLEMWDKLANANQFIGISLGRRNELLRALEYGKENVRIRQSYLALDERQADAYTDLGFHYDHLGRYDSAVWAYQLAEKTFLQLPDTLWKSLGLVCHNISYVFGMIGDHRQELQYGEKALDYWLKGKDLLPDYLLNCYSHLAEIYKDLGDCEKSQDYYNQALESARNNYPKHSTTLGTTYLKMGQSCLGQTQPQQALDYLDRSLDVLLDMPNPNYSYIGIVHSTKGRLYKDLERYDESLKEFQEALALHAGVADADRRLFEDYINMAGLYRSTKEWPQSLLYLRKSLPQAQKTNSIHLPLIYVGMGYLYAQLNLPDSSLIWTQRALAAMTGDANLAELNWALNPEIDQFFHNQRSLGILENKATALFILAQQAPDNKQLLKDCKAAYELCLEVIQSMQIRSQSTREILTEESLRVYEGAIQCSYLLYEMEGEEGYLADILKLIEQSKSASLRKNLQRSRAVLQAGLPNHLLQKERELSAQIAFYQQKIFNKKIDQQEEDTVEMIYWQEKLFLLNEEKRDLHSHLADAYPSYYQIRYGKEEVSLQSVRKELLEEGEWLLDFFLGDTTFIVLAISADQSKVYQKTVHQEWKDRLESFMDNLVAYHQYANPDLTFQQFSEDANDWYQELLGPVLGIDSRPPEALLILPDDVLALMPFELLLTSRPAMQGNMYNKLPYLLKFSQVRYAYSLSWLETIPQRRFRLTSPTFLGIAPAYEQKAEPEFANLRGVPLNERGPFRSLVHNKTEIQSISQVWRGQSLLGKGATEAEFKKNCSKYDVLHLAMHAYLEYDDPLYSALVFSGSTDERQDEDRFLHAYEIYNLDMDIEMLVLSACETGIGRVEKGEGVQSLAQAFAYAGAQSMVTSLWQIDDASTGWIMERMYEYLSAGESRPQALRLARLDYVNKFPAAHPGYWGAYVFWGNPDPLSPGFSTRDMLWIASVMILLIGLLFVWRKRRNLRQIF